MQMFVCSFREPGLCSVLHEEQAKHAFFHTMCLLPHKIPVVAGLL